MVTPPPRVASTDRSAECATESVAPILDIPVASVGFAVALSAAISPCRSDRDGLCSLGKLIIGAPSAAVAIPSGFGGDGVRQDLALPEDECRFCATSIAPGIRADPVPGLQARAGHEERLGMPARNDLPRGPVRPG